MKRSQVFTVSSCDVLLVATLMLTLTPPIASAAILPVYTSVFNDAITGDAPNPISFGGKFYWAIDAGADSYANDFYERPTTQTYKNIGGGIVGASYYFGNLDIVAAKAGFDSQYLYFAIDLFSSVEYKDDGGSDNKGLDYRYGIRLSDQAADGGNG